MPVVNFRVDEDTLAELDTLVELTPGSNRSQVLRDMILMSTLRNPEKRAAIVQASFDYSQLQKIIFRKLSARLQSILPDVVDEALAETAARLAED